MKIIETVDLANKDKVSFGYTKLKLTYDTETQHVEIEIPTMIGNSVVNLDELRKRLETLSLLAEDELAARRQPRDPGKPQM